ncbi:NCS2 family permease [Nocardioides yefusunii]|uniref:NCS2 family permease n=1 Tax=Nocardioides yefusunii TaxID=2500546 RepID=A0ABW1R2F4_9ACTN|nr:NCS2 family permease [Nocardioides yefusunii]
MTNAAEQTAPPASGGLDRFFKISERGSSVAREVRGGIVTFLAMAYIVVLNPLILGLTPDSTGQYLGGGTVAGANLAAITAATALVAGLLSILMGAVANFPLALAAGLGLNAFVANSIARDTTWEAAMGLVVLEGVVILVLVLTGFRKAVFKAVPQQLKVAISVGIGLFIALLGMVDARFVTRIPDAFGTTVPVQLGADGHLQGWPVLVFCVGLLVMIALWVRKVPGAILLGIVVATVLSIIVDKLFTPGSSMDSAGGWALNQPSLSGDWGLPDLSTLFRVDLFGAFSTLEGGVLAALLLIFSLLLADFFDTMGTMTAIGAEAGLNDEDGTPPHAQRILIVDSVAAIAGGVGGVSSNTSFIESASGVGEGARTGLSTIVTGLLFLATMFLSPLVSAIPSEAAVPALVLVGFLMMQQVTEIDWTDVEIAIPAFLTIIVMPFTYSISAGIGAGFIAFLVIKLVMGKLQEIHALMWVVAALFVVYFAYTPISGWIN